MTTPPAIRLSRILVDLRPDDVEAVWAWMREALHNDVVLHGHPTDRLWMVGPGFVETLDLARLRQRDPEADPGATWQALRTAHPDRAHFAVLHNPRSFDIDLLDVAWLVRADSDGFQTDTLDFVLDEESGLGHPCGWTSHGRSDRAPPGLLPWSLGARPARVLPPRTPRADVGVRYGELPADRHPPVVPLHLVELVSRLFVPDLLAGRVHGVIVVRLCGRAVESYQLPNASPVPLDDFVRHVANVHAPPAEAAAIVQLSVQPDATPPTAGVQIVAEVAGAVAETWSPLTFPDGPHAPATITEVQLRRRETVPESGLWIGVAPAADLALTTPATGEA